MQESQIFHTDTYKELEKKIREILNDKVDSISPNIINSPRSMGDEIEKILKENFKVILGNLSKKYYSQFERRKMEDFAFTDQNDFYYAVDVKTHNLGTKFNMPNLTSVQRLSQFYEDDKKYFVVLKVSYKTEDTKVVIDKVVFVPIEFLAWDCLTLGALGWGQIQIANANEIIVLPQNERKKWMIDMCDSLLKFYQKEILKINDKRIKYFEKIKNHWLGK